MYIALDAWVPLQVWQKFRTTANGTVQPLEPPEPGPPGPPGPLEPPEPAHVDPDDALIRASHTPKDMFHVMQILGYGFGTSNTWSPLFLKVTAESCVIPDPSVYNDVLVYLTKTLGSLPEAKKQIHSFVRKKATRLVLSAKRYFSNKTKQIQNKYIERAVTVDLRSLSISSTLTSFFARDIGLGTHNTS